MPPYFNQSICKTDQRNLLEIARRAIVEAVLHNDVHDQVCRPAIVHGALAEPRGVFVTLEYLGKLRGCVGQVTLPDPLALAVAHCAVAAARNDARFSPLRPQEVAGLTIEISVLSPMELILPEQIEVGVHGLMVASGPFRGVLLPQVSVEHRWTRERFLQETCDKAGLPKDAWKSQETRLFGFTTEIFSEEDLPGAVSNPSGHSSV